MDSVGYPNSAAPETADSPPLPCDPLFQYQQDAGFRRSAFHPVRRACSVRGWPYRHSSPANLAANQSCLPSKYPGIGSRNATLVRHCPPLLQSSALFNTAQHTGARQIPVQCVTLRRMPSLCAPDGLGCATPGGPWVDQLRRCLYCAPSGRLPRVVSSAPPPRRSPGCRGGRAPTADVLRCRLKWPRRPQTAARAAVSCSGLDGGCRGCNDRNGGCDRGSAAPRQAETAVATVIVAADHFVCRQQPACSARADSGGATAAVPRDAPSHGQARLMGRLIHRQPVQSLAGAAAGRTGIDLYGSCGFCGRSAAAETAATPRRASGGGCGSSSPSKGCAVYSAM